MIPMAYMNPKLILVGSANALVKENQVLTGVNCYKDNFDNLPESDLPELW
jgi:hypothetical protein